MMRRPASLIATAFAMVFAASCGSDSGTGPTLDLVAGTWNLVSLNGVALPVVLQASPKVELLHDQIIFGADGRFTESYSARVTSGTETTTESGTDAGTYTVSGALANMVYSDQSSQSASVTSSTMTIVGGSFTQVYQKQ